MHLTQHDNGQVPLREAINTARTEKVNENVMQFASLGSFPWDDAIKMSKLIGHFICYDIGRCRDSSDAVCYQIDWSGLIRMGHRGHDWLATEDM